MIKLSIKYAIFIFVPIILAHENNNQMTSYVTALHQGFNEPLNSQFVESLKQQFPNNNKEFERQVLLPQTISRSFAIEEPAEIVTAAFPTAYTSLDFIAENYSIWKARNHYLVLRDKNIVTNFESAAGLIYKETDKALWIAQDRTKQDAHILVISKSDNSIVKFPLQYTSVESFQHEPLSKSFYLVCYPLNMNRSLYKISEDQPFTKQLMHEFVNSSREYSCHQAYHLLNDQFFLFDSINDDRCSIVDLTNKNVISYIGKKDKRVQTKLSHSKNMLALVGDKIKYNSTRFSVIMYDISNLQQPIKVKHLKFNKPIIDMQFIPGQDHKIIVVTNEPSSQRLRLYDSQSDLFVDIHTDFINHVRINQETLYFYNFLDKKVTNWENNEVDRDKKALYKVDYKALYMYQLLKASKQSPLVPTEFNLTRDSRLEAPEYN